MELLVSGATRSWSYLHMELLVSGATRPWSYSPLELLALELLAPVGSKCAGI